MADEDILNDGFSLTSVAHPGGEYTDPHEIEVVEYLEDQALSGVFGDKDEAGTPAYALWKCAYKLRVLFGFPTDEAHLNPDALEQVEIEIKKCMKIVKWVSYEEASKLPEAVGGMGGWFGHSDPTPENPIGKEVSHRWKDYLDMWKPEGHPYVEAIRAAVLEGNIRNGGFWHQKEGCPVFEDGKAACFSMRAWGDLMAAIWSEKENKDYSYCDFAWYSKEEEKDG